MVVTVQMVGRDVKQHGNVSPETVHVVQLETAQFYHIIVIIFLGHLQGQALADISGQPDVVTRFLEDMINQGRSSGLAVAARNTNHLGVRIASGKFYFRDNGNTGGFHLQHHRGIFRYARAFYHLVRIQDQFFRMAAVFPRNPVTVQHVYIMRFDFSHIGNKDIKAFFLSQHCSTHAAFGRSQYYHSFPHSFFLI